MFSRLFGSKKKEKIEVAYNGQPLVNDFSFLGADMHSHFLPGIDDGAQTMEDSIALISHMKQLGYKRMIPNSQEVPTWKAAKCCTMQLMKRA